MWPRYLAVALALTLAGQPLAAAACSLDMRPTWDRINSIRHDRDLIRVRGGYVLDEVRGEPLNDPERPGWVTNAVLIGHVELSDGRRFQTFHPAANELIEEALLCLADTYHLPRSSTGRAVFFISRQRRDGRQELLHMDALRRADRYRTR